jgi:hypothetical protein
MTALRLLKTVNREIGAKCQDDGETQYLQSQSREHEMDAYILEAAVVGYDSYCAATGLKDEGPEV